MLRWVALCCTVSQATACDCADHGGVCCIVFYCVAMRCIGLLIFQCMYYSHQAGRNSRVSGKGLYSIFTIVTQHCNKLQQTATHCNALQHTTTHCNTLQHTATHWQTCQMVLTRFYEEVESLHSTAQITEAVCCIVFYCVALGCTTLYCKQGDCL